MQALQGDVPYLCPVKYAPGIGVGEPCKSAAALPVEAWQVNMAVWSTIRLL